jgi:uncharacterized protein (TIGR01777 family)
MKTIVIAGASGFIGQYVSDYFKSNGWRILTVGRSHADATWNDQPSLVRALNGADAVLNLAGKSVNCRFTPENVRELIRSRVETTQALGDAMLLCKEPPRVWINASGASIYKEHVNKPNTENSPPDGEGTMADVARLWEKALKDAGPAQTCKVALRITLVLGRNGGVYPIFRRLTNLRQGGAQGSGNQMMSWIHIHDLSRLIYATVHQANPPKILNAAAPDTCSNREFMKALRTSMQISIGIGAPEALIKLGTTLLGVDSELILKGMNVTSSEASQMDFEFDYPTLIKAFMNLNQK